MKVLVTGGTGFVGSHIVAALVGGGHDVRLLVRRKAQVERTFRLHGHDVLDAITDVVVGDVLDEGVVAKAVVGCDAVVHAAAVFSFDPRDAASHWRTTSPEWPFTSRQPLRISPF